MNGGGGRGKKKKGQRKVVRNDPSIITPRKRDDSGDDAGPPGRGGHTRPTPDRSAAKARRGSNRSQRNSPGSEQADLCVPVDNHELRVLMSGGRRGRMPSQHRSSDFGWDDDLLNVRAQCVVCPDIHEDLEYDDAYQRLRPRNTKSNTNEVPEAEEKCILEGNRIINVANLSSFLTNKTACRLCATRAAVQVAFDFASMLDEEAGVATRQRSGPSYGNRLQNYIKWQCPKAKTMQQLLAARAYHCQVCQRKILQQAWATEKQSMAAVNDDIDAWGHCCRVGS